MGCEGHADCLSYRSAVRLLNNLDAHITDYAFSVALLAFRQLPRAKLEFRIALCFTIVEGILGRA